MILFSQKVGVSRCHALQVYDIASFISASYTFNLDATSDLNFFALSINELVDLDVHLLAHLQHHLMELFIALNCLLLINCSILRKRCKFRVIEDARND